MKKYLATLFLISIAFGAHAQLLWKVSGNELEKPSYIFGTHHLAPFSIMDSIPGIMAAFGETTQVVGELLMADMQTPEAVQAMQKLMMIPNDTTLQTLLTPDEYEMVNTFTKENLGLNLDMAPKLKPGFISNNVVVVLCAKNMPGFNPQQQLDAFFQNLGKETGKKLGALETMEFQLNLLFNSSSLQRQAEILVCQLSDVEKTIDSAMKITDAYMTQDLDKIYELSKEKEGTKCDMQPEEFNALIDNRNIAWMDKLPEMIKQESTFVVVGAAHLPGENGVLNLLKNAGYTVEGVK